jgi:hypothetical protein
VLRHQHRGVRPPRAIGWLGVHLQQPRAGPDRRFLTGWMMIFGYVLFVPAGIALTWCGDLAQFW